jgi:uncharacterized protein involved in exopolysaccharide biosynthesis
MNPSYEYTSQSVLYTGLATGSSIEMDKKFSTQATNTAFDNLINIIKSRETQEEVAVRLLALHLLLPEANPKYISKAHYEELRATVPEGLYGFLEEENNIPFDNEEDEVNMQLPSEIDKGRYEKTVQNLLNLMRSGTDNFMYELFSYEENKHYSLKALSEIKAQRINSSDLIKMSYTVNDPGICQLTLAIYNAVCIKNYKILKENRSGSVVKYFENELAKAKKQLDNAERKLLEFNKSSNIINYYEQSKAVAVVKEELEVDYKAKKAELAGIQAGTKRLEEKLRLQEIIQLKSNELLKKKKELGDLNYQIGLVQAQLESSSNPSGTLKISQLKSRANTLNGEIEERVDELYTYQNTIDGLQISKVLPDWMSSEVETENLKAKIKVIDDQKKDFQKTYAEYAPAGATMKRLEREIAVAEQGYLEILHGLNLAKLKLQDSELASDLKTVDPPYFPLSPNPTKRSILIIAATFLGGIITLGAIFVMEYFDDTLKNAIKATKKTGIQALGMVPKIILDPKGIDLAFVQNRLTEIIAQNMLQFFGKQNGGKKPKTIIVFSTQKFEGKTVVAGNLAKALQEEGKCVVVLNHSNEMKSLSHKQKFSFFSKIFGYPDTRIDMENDYLKDPSIYLGNRAYIPYDVENDFGNANDFRDLISKDASTIQSDLDYVIVELPALIYNNYPVDLFSSADLNLLVVRSNRTWTSADESSVGNLMEISGEKLHLVVNGVNLNEAETILGDLPKKRNKLRKKIKSMLRFQFLSKQHI